MKKKTYITNLTLSGHIRWKECSATDEVNQEEWMRMERFILTDMGEKESEELVIFALCDEAERIAKKNK